MRQFAKKRQWGYNIIKAENMGDKNIPFNYLETLPLNNITKYSDGPPKNGVPLTGYPQQHRTDKNKIILVYDPLGSSPAVLEFKLDDILYVAEVHSAVTEKGEGVPLVKLWVRRGARGVLMEPFEVDESLGFLELRGKQKDHFMKQPKGDFQSSNQKSSDSKHSARH